MDEEVIPGNFWGSSSLPDKLVRFFILSFEKYFVLLQYDMCLEGESKAHV